nr:hypothetical protein [Tanacetum cinerariifolium]
MGIPLMNAGEFLEMDPYEEVYQQGQAHPLSPTYVPDPMELDEHVPVYVLEPEYPKYHAPSDDDIQVEDDDENLEEDPSKEHEPEDDDEDPEEDPNEEHKLEDEDTKEPSEGRRASMIHMRDDIPEEDMLPRRRFVLTAPSPGCDVAKSSAAAARAPRSQYDFVDTIIAGQGLIRSPGHDARTIARAADKAEDVGYTDHRDIRLQIDVVRSQRTAYETKLQERQSAENLVVTKIMRIQAQEARARTDTMEDAGSSC